MDSWPHGPTHFLGGTDAYIVTAATYRKLRIFRTREHLNRLFAQFESLTIEHQITMQAWAVFPNHYHFIATLKNPQNLRRFIQHFHSVSAREINRDENLSGRRVWFQYWETYLTFERSFFARLRYVHENPVRHRLVRVASQYPWCSAGWFERTAAPAFRKTINAFPCDKVDVPDAFDVAIDDFSAL